MDSKQRYKYIIKQQNKYKQILMNNSIQILTEQDFYPPYDDRTLKSNVEDIVDGDNFANYCEEFFDLLDEEEYYND